MNKREVMLSLLDDSKELPYTPAAFFLHFPPQFHAGQAAVDKQLEFFRHTNMDFVKIQFEDGFPLVPGIQTADDWAKMPPYGRDHFEGQLKAVEGLVKAAKREALVIMTLYSTFMCAAHTVRAETLVEHLNREPEKVKKGLEIITDSLLAFVRECIKLGVDGFYTSTQGGEAGRFADPHIFEQYVKPYDLVMMKEVNQACPFNILHVCDYARDYDDFSLFLNYPGHIVNCPLNVGGKKLTPKEAASLFKRPFMGGLERKGAIAGGTPEQIRSAVEAVLGSAPERFVLAADCTVPNDTPWDNLKTAIAAAHAHKR